jgi:hypothetical protein
MRINEQQKQQIIVSHVVIKKVFYTHYKLL